jgi:hypothetical protein
MGKFVKEIAGSFAIAVLLFGSACRRAEVRDTQNAAVMPAVSAATPISSPGPEKSPFPNLQAELLDDRNKTTTSPLGQFDFKNFSYPLPRGWQNPDNADLVLTNGRLEPVSADTDLGMDPDQIAEARAKRRIGASYVTAKYLDVNGDGQDEAIVVLKIETTGSSIPQLVYVYEWKDGRPEMLWNFGTGDRADGGLKDIRLESGIVVIELYGQDRFLLGSSETGKITGDEEQLCCPTFFTRTAYKWNGKNFQLQGKRLTFSVADPSSPPQENLAEIVNAKERSKK